MTYTIDTLDVDGSAMEVFLFTPNVAGPHPAIILCQHIPVGHAGLEHDEFTLVSAQRLANEGYVVAVPFIFHWWPKTEDVKVKAGEFRDDRVIADLKATCLHLKSIQSVDHARIGIVGHCWGGRVSWLGACQLPELAACVLFYGGRIDKKLGPVELTEKSKSPLEQTGNIACPVAGFFGNEDQNPTPELVDSYEAALKKSKVSYVFHRYDGAGHAFQNFPTPERYREQQSEDAWSKCIEFLDQHLGSQ